MGRVKRWYETFQLIDAGRRQARNTDYFQDEVYAFFQNCYHLKDWLRNDPGVASRVSDVEARISQSVSLSLCADLANGSKHLRLQRHRVDRHTAITRRDVRVSVGVGVAVKYHVSAAGDMFDAFELASQCVTEWQEYLRSKKLLSPEQT